MKILTAEEMRQADVYTIKHEPIKSIDLMERASVESVKWIINSPQLKSLKHISVFCGLGNNGGDGLAIARLLAAKKYKVEVFIIRHSDKYSSDFLVNEKRIKKVKSIKVHNIKSIADLEKCKLPISSVFIDAIFGSGLRKPIGSLTADVIAFMNKLGSAIISIDIPSGLFSEYNIHDKENYVVRASHTLTFQAPKLAFMFPENGLYLNSFTVLDIGLNTEFISALSTKVFYVEDTEARFIYRKRSKYSHKGTFGHALIVAGSFGKMGASVLSSRACLSAGAGLVTAHIPKCGYDILQISNPEVMTEVDSGINIISDNIKIEKYNTIAVGPGIGADKQTQNALKTLIQNLENPMVLDADALNILSENKTWIAFLPKNSILTPHLGEFKRLIGKTDSDMERLKMQKEFSIKNGVIVILKGAHTCTTTPDGEIYFNSTGNPGMATAGSGDVLTGIITGLLAQGYTPKRAAVLGVYIHGLAADLAAENASEESLIASKIIGFLGTAFAKLRK